MVVVPIDHEIDETQQVTQEDRPELDEVAKLVASGWMESQNHDRNDDGEDGIAKRLHAI